MTLEDILSRARCLLVDFDGPICSVFAGHPAPVLAGQLLDLIGDRIGTVPPELAELTANPLQLLRQVADVGDEDLTRDVANACRDAEVVAVESATPTPGAHGVLRAAYDVGLPVVIVSNNASQAVEAYLKIHTLGMFVHGIAARSDDLDPRLLKPHSFLVEAGLNIAGVGATRAAFIGDSDTDIEAGRAAGTATIGYANKPGKHERLTTAGADSVIDTMHALIEVIRPVTTRSAM
jgi:phosphoglycolate phosphatase